MAVNKTRVVVVVTNTRRHFSAATTPLMMSLVQCLLTVILQSARQHWHFMLNDCFCHHREACRCAATGNAQDTGHRKYTSYRGCTRYRQRIHKMQRTQYLRCNIIQNTEDNIIMNTQETGNTQDAEDKIQL